MHVFARVDAWSGGSLLAASRSRAWPAEAGHRFAGSTFLGVRERVVEGRDGRRWVVRRRWALRRGGDTLWAGIRRRFPWHRLEEGADVLDPGWLLGGRVGGAVLFVALFVLVVGVGLVLAIVDVIVLLVVSAAGQVGRTVFRRPWTVEARAGDGTVRTWKVVGWRASRERLDEIAELLAAGISPPG
jgi:hypothetical protein